MPVIDHEDPSSWPMGWEPKFVTEAREAGYLARRHGIATIHNPYTERTLSHRAWLSGWDSASIAIARERGWTFEFGKDEK